MMVAMDTKFGRIYCAISDVRNFLYFQLQLPRHFYDRNETCHIKELLGSTKGVSEFNIFAPKIYDFLNFNHVINCHILQ